MPNLDTPSLDNLGLQVRSDLDKSSQDMSDQAKSQGIRSSEKFWRLKKRTNTATELDKSSQVINSAKKDLTRYQISWKKIWKD